MSALLEKARPDHQIGQFTYLLWVVSSPKKEGHCSQQAEVEAHKAGIEAGPRDPAFKRRLNIPVKTGTEPDQVFPSWTELG